MKEKFILQSRDSTVFLRTAVEADCEDLRLWKNAHRESFFHTDIISAEQQREWYDAYLERTDDWMFIVGQSSRTFGSMGFRLLGDQRVDIYNVILGDAKLGGMGRMSQAMRLMCSYVVSRLTSEIIARVLNSNPAQGWYLKNNFTKAKVFDFYSEFVFARANFQPLVVTKTILS